MNEDFLHYLWKYQLFDISKLRTTKDEPVFVIQTGLHNRNSGPDFLNAKIEIGNYTSTSSVPSWFGNVEIHLKSSDWYAHHHEVDANYDAVILHVVWEHDEEVFVKSNVAIPTLELKNIVPSTLLEKYRKLYQKPVKWIPCENELQNVDPFFVNNWLERLYIQRLERKSHLIQQLLSDSNNDWEAVLFQLLAKNFGLKVNGETFLKLATSIPFSIIRKEQSDLMKLSALLYGQAGFLEETMESSYYNVLKKEYRYLKHKYQLTSLDKNEFLFFRMRPSNFPTIRIAQLIGLYHQHQNVFSLIIQIKHIGELYEIFKIEVPEFWKTHYRFGKTSKSKKKPITKSFVELLLINTVIPLQFCYHKNRNQLQEEQLLQLMKEIVPEKNQIISLFSEHGITAKNGFESQALLELKNNYCAFKRCLECAIGNQLLKN